MAVGVVAAFLAVAPAASASADTTFGISEPDAWRHNPAHASPSEIAALVDEVGASSHEFWVHWDTVEPQAPIDGQHTYRFEEYDRMYEADLARGIRPLITVQSSPPWTWQSGITNAWLPEQPPSPAHYDDWQAFLAALTERYPEAVGIQIWNEPNLWYFWGLGDPLAPTDPDAYTDLLQQAYSAIKGADPAMPVIGGAVNNHGATAAGQISMQDFIEGMLQDGAANYMDGLSIHPYPGEPSLINFDQSMAQVRALLSTHGVHLPLWITEVGITTTGGAAVTESQQAQALRSIMRRVRESQDVAAVYFHNLTEPTQDPANPEMGYGLVSGQGVGASFRRKPAFTALQQEWASPTEEPPAARPPFAVTARPAATRQDLSRRRVAISVICNSECRLIAHGRLRMSRPNRATMAGHLRTASGAAAAGRKVNLKIRIPAKLARRARTALAHGGKVLAQVEVSATDRAGSAQQSRARIRLHA